MSEWTALQKFQEYGADEELNPIERLRFFCSLVMKGQDWLNVEQFFDNVEKELSAMKQRADAAEARIKESQEHEPFGYWHVGSCEDENDFFLTSESGDVRCPDCVVLYTNPPIPPDIAELWVYENHQHEKFFDVVPYNSYARRITIDDIVELQSELKLQDDANEILQRENTELIKLLAEAKSKAVPEGWQLMPIKLTEQMGGAFQDAWLCLVGTDAGFAQKTVAGYEAMLAAAPQPGGSNE